MKLDQITVPLIPRTTTNCLDLGVMFYGRHLAAILKLWACFAVPIGIFVYVAATWFEWNLGYVAMLLYFATGPFGILLAERTVVAAFGGSFDQPERTTRRQNRLIKMTLRVLGTRLLIAPLLIGLIFPYGLLVLVLAAWPIWVRVSFAAEKVSLAELQGRKHDRRTGELVKQEYSQLLSRTFGVALFLLIAWTVLFLCLDFMSANLFDYPIFLDRAAANVDLQTWMEPFFSLLGRDPLVLTTEAMVFLLAYPIARFAWFFCYIDLRVRDDFWDLELQFQKELERLGETAA